jgi:hypothetical protein
MPFFLGVMGISWAATLVLHPYACAAAQADQTYPDPATPEASPRRVMIRFILFIKFFIGFMEFDPTLSARTFLVARTRAPAHYSLNRLVSNA